MRIKSLVHTATVAGVALFMMAANASAATITINTNGAGTGFGAGGAGGLSLGNSSGAAATLSFTPIANTAYGVPSNVSFGTFNLSCPSCTTLANGTGSFFNSFTFEMIIGDVTDGATGKFTGTSTGGAVYSDLSGITVNWAPLSLGPGMTNALSGDFGPSIISTTIFTGIVAPNSNNGQSTVQGYVDSAAIPEPATFSLLGGGLLALGFIRRRRTPRT